jgi:plastocyanin
LLGVVTVSALAPPVLSGAANDTRATRTTRTATVGDIFYRPASLTVRRGSRVRWVWRGRLPHNVTVVRGPTSFRSPTQRSGSFTRVLRRRGAYRLICTIHGPSLQSMRIRVR